MKSSPASRSPSVGQKAGVKHWRGVVYLVERAMNMLKMDPEKCTAIVQGFGNVGSVAALSLAYKSGVKVVGISDHTAAIYNPKGIDVKSAEQHMIKKGTCGRSLRMIM
jgi:Glutamate dehydrogenase/leucine dehydrogenase